MVCSFNLIHVSSVFAQTEIYTATGNYAVLSGGKTITASTVNSCTGSCYSVSGSGSQTFLLPAGSTGVKAYLVWSGLTTTSGSMDNNMSLNGNSVTSSSTVMNGISGSSSNLAFYYSMADITSLAQSLLTPSATVTLTGSGVDNYFCGGGAGHAGWALWVVYQSSTLPSTKINLYSLNFTSPYNGSLNLTYNNITYDAGCKNINHGYIAWDGDTYKTNEVYSLNGTNYTGVMNGSTSDDLDIDTYNVTSLVTGSSLNAIYSNPLFSFCSGTASEIVGFQLSWITSTVSCCSNVTNAGSIGTNAFACVVSGGTYDPPVITSLSLPTGGSGALEYVWLVSTNGGSTGTTIANSNSATYDPPAISQTTSYRRCARRAGCPDYVGESNWVTFYINSNCSVANVTNCSNTSWGYGPWLDLRYNGTYAPEYAVDWGNWTENCSAGTVTITGQIHNVLNPNVKYTMNFTATGRTDFTGADPHWGTSSQQCNTWENADYYYYTAMTGTLTGVSGTLTAGSVINFNISGQPPFQVGTGATGYSTVEKQAAVWMNVTSIQQPTSGTITNGGGGTDLYFDLDACNTCDNVTSAGTITPSTPTGCLSASGSFDPGIINNTTLPSGGTGSLEYLWLYSTDGGATGTAIANSNSASYDPPAITQTTCYRRCSRRTGCGSYVGETTWVCVTIGNSITTTINGT
jgi:hypothetical protein